MNSTNSSRGSPRLKADPLRIAAAAALAIAALGGLLHLAGLEPASALPEAVLCPFRALTNLPCPGCGMTRAFLALGRLDFAGAWARNPLSFPLAALMALFAAGRVPRVARSARAANLALFGVLAFWGARLLGHVQ